ncbi:MAG: DASS family sodium-coupled anion symporter [Planctomycetes bacterium]|nr:DASS family sodium-coupled anion symporter [Planctomycetota bacterium]
MRQNFKLTALLTGLLLGVMTYVGCKLSLQMAPPAAITAAVTVICATWWCTEALPIPVTALVPFAVFPCAGVLNHKQIAEAYGDKFVLLFMAGFMLSRAAEKSKTHLRVAHGMIRLVGSGSSRRLVIAFLLATAVCSMWISNTATTLIMLPVALAVLEEHKGHIRFPAALLLAIAYGSSIGGIATIVGTPPNGVFVGAYEKFSVHQVSFAAWMKVGLPISALMLIAAAFVLCARIDGAMNMKMESLGPWTKYQRRVLAVMSVTALLWITRTSPDGGWAGYLNMPLAEDATVAIAAVIAMFLIPSGEHDADGEREHLLDWATAKDIPWGILLLFGGGIAIAEAFKETGLAQSIGDSLNVLAHWPPLLVIAMICFAVTFLTEVTSNTATTTLLMPILGAAANSVGVDPALFMIPAAISASCAFMLPVATPPNAIVFASDHVTIPQMARTGFVLNLLGVVIVTLVCYFVLSPTTGLN